MPIGYARGVDALVSAEPLLRVRDLRIAFGGREAVRGISFSIARGETLGLVGESGSGKSATSLAVMRLLGANALVTGSALWCGDRGASARVQESGPGAPDILQELGDGLPAVDLLTLPDEAMRRVRGREIAMVFQEPMTALNPVMTVGRQIAEALLAHAPKMGRREVRERVQAAMREVGLPEPERRCDDYPHQFSGGQRQRVVIAMAIVNKPKLLIADEPTTALDVTVQAQILALLQRLRQEHGLAMLFISHDLAVIGQVADRVAVMQRGEIVELGETRQVLTAPNHPYTRSLLASAPTMTTNRELPLATVGTSG